MATQIQFKTEDLVQQLDVKAKAEANLELMSRSLLDQPLMEVNFGILGRRIVKEIAGFNEEQTKEFEYLQTPQAEFRTIESNTDESGFERS